MTRATFVTAASPQIGGGHVLRCLALAEGLAALGVEAKFATDRLTVDTVGLLRASPFEVIETAPAEAHRHKAAGEADIAIFDGYAAGFIYGLLSGVSEEEAVKLGWAHGALLTTFPGDTTMATVEQVKAFAKGGSARIQR